MRLRHPYTCCVHCESRNTDTQYHGLWLCRECHDRSSTKVFYDRGAVVTVTEIDDERYSSRIARED